MGYGWGGIVILFLLMGGFLLIEAFLGKFDRKFFYLSSAWFLTMLLFLSGYIFRDYGGSRFNIDILVSSSTSGLTIFAFLIGAVYFFLFELVILRIKKFLEGKKPLSVLSIIIAITL